MDQNRCTTIYRNGDHTNCIVDVIDQMRKRLLLCDVTLLTSDGEISSHKLILAACSQYFYTRLINSNKNELRIKSVDSQTLSSILEYIYRSEIEITGGNVLKILIASNLLQLTELRDFCCQFLKNRLNYTNCLDIRTEADLHDFQDLLKNAEDFIFENFLDVAKTHKFLKLSYDEVTKIISKDELKVPSEAEVCESVLNWIKHDLNSRRQYLVSLMKNIRICFLPKEYINETFMKEPLLKDDPQCQGFLIETLQCLILKPGAKTETIKRRQYEDLPKILLVAGGNSSLTSVEYYDFEEKCWSKLADMPVGRDGGGSAVLNEKVYIMGGANENTINIYDSAADKWIPGIDMQLKRQHLGVVVLGNCIYAVGGKNDGGSLNTVEKFDPATEQWTMLAPMLSRRYGHGVGVIDGILYAVGGHDGANYLNSVESYNPTTNTWTYVESMNLKRSQVAVGVLNGMIYAVGGHVGFSYQKSVEVFDTTTGNWTMIKDMSNCRSGAAAVGTNNLLYVIGGSDGSKNWASVEVYDPNTTTWSVLSNCMIVGRYSHCVAVIDKFT